MYPLNVVLIGGVEETLPFVRKELNRANATVEEECADMKEAIGRLSVACDRLRLFILQVDSEEDVNTIKALSNRFPGHAILALIGPGVGAQTVINVMRAGAVQTVQLPWQPEDFQTALNQIALQFGRAPSNKVIAVAGVHGGAGATMLAINLAYEIALQQNVRCVLAELSMHRGVVASYLNVKPKFGIADLAGEDVRLDAYAVQEMLLRVTDRFSVIPGVSEDAILSESVFSVAQMLQVVDYCRYLAEVTVLDVPCTYDRFYFEILAAVDQVVLVANQTVPSIQAMKMVMDGLAKEGFGKSIIPVFNRYNGRKPGYTTDSLKRLLQVAEVFTVVEDPKLDTLFEQGGSIRLRLPRSPMLADLAVLSASLMGTAPSPLEKATPRGWFAELFHAADAT